MFKLVGWTDEVGRRVVASFCLQARALTMLLYMLAILKCTSAFGFLFMMTAVQLSSESGIVGWFLARIVSTCNKFERFGEGSIQMIMMGDINVHKIRWLKYSDGSILEAVNCYHL